MNLPMRDIPADQSLIEYPCRFPIKVMGVNVDGYVHAVTEIARRFDPTIDDTNLPTSLDDTTLFQVIAGWREKA